MSLIVNQERIQAVEANAANFDDDKNDGLVSIFFYLTLLFQLG